MKRLSCVLLGGGGHARVLMDVFSARGALPAYILDSNAAMRGRILGGVRIFGNDTMLPALVKKGIKYFVVAVGTTGKDDHRERLFKLGLSHRLTPFTVVDPTAVISPSAYIGRGCQLLPRSIVNADSILGENIIVNTGAIIEHDCRIADHVHLATASVLAGTVSVDRGAFVGSGAIVLQNIRVGEKAVVGAGAVVIKDVKPLSVVVGIPACPLRTTKRR